MYSVLGLRARLHRRIGLMGEDSDGGEWGLVVDPGVEEAPGASPGAQAVFSLWARPVHSDLPIEPPGLNNAESSTSGWFVAANMITPEFPENPSISVKREFREGTKHARWDNCCYWFWAGSSPSMHGALQPFFLSRFPYHPRHSLRSLFTRRFFFFSEPTHCYCANRRVFGSSHAWIRLTPPAGSQRDGMEVRLIPGLPEEMGLTFSDLKRRPGGHPLGGPPSSGLTFAQLSVQVKGLSVFSY